MLYKAWKKEISRKTQELRKQRLFTFIPLEQSILSPLFCLCSLVCGFLSLSLSKWQKHRFPGKGKNQRADGKRHTVEKIESESKSYFLGIFYILLCLTFHALDRQMLLSNNSLWLGQHQDCPERCPLRILFFPLVTGIRTFAKNLQFRESQSSWGEKALQEIT